MKKIDLGQAANTIASLGVIVGIVFLAVELNQNQDLARAQMRNEIALSWQELSRDDIEGLIPELLARDEEDLDEADELRLDIYRNMWLRNLDNIYYQYRQGLYSEAAFNANMSILLNDLGLQEYRCEYPGSYDPEFLAFVDTYIEESCE